MQNFQRKSHIQTKETIIRRSKINWEPFLSLLSWIRSPLSQVQGPLPSGTSLDFFYFLLPFLPFPLSFFPSFPLFVSSSASHPACCYTSHLVAAPILSSCPLERQSEKKIIIIIIIKKLKLLGGSTVWYFWRIYFNCFKLFSLIF